MSCNTPFKINLFISLLSIFFLSVGISPPLPSLATPISEINIKSGKTYSYELDNGLRILIKENHNHPLVAISALVDAGSSSEYGFYGSGISHFIEHMLFKGTEKYKTGEIHKIIQSLGGTINGYTTLDYTLYHVTVPVENFNTALDIISDMLQNATFNEDEFNKEKKVILEEIKMNEDKPEKSVLLNLWNEAFTKHPYRFPVIGKKLLFLNLTREDLFQFYKRRYAPNNIILSIAGDINHKDAYFKVSKLFSKFNPRPYEIKSLDSIEPRQRLKRKRIEEIETQLVYLALGFKSVDINSKDIYALDVLAHILGKGRSSRLALKLKDEEELVYSIESFNYTPKYKGLFIITATLEEDNLDDTICAIFKEIDRIKDKGVDETELEKAKNTILVNGLKYLQTLEAQVQDIATSLYFTNDADFTYKYLKRINQQTKRDIQRVAKKYLISERSTISLVLPKNKSSEVKHHNDDKSKEVKPIKKIILSNGITLLLKEDRSLPLVDIQLVFEGGLRYETKDNNGICNLMTQLFLEGTKNRTKYELNRSLEERGISINTFSQNNSFGISASLLSKDLEFAISLLSDVLLYPEFSKDALKHKKKIIKAAIRKEEDDIFSYGFLV
ncbi:MAG TPA: insulinase family protein, partial [Candidatus Omnitrophica bacterium]|nr:insulinase family protein [Candidatus Omnitrophota bacterium]